MQPLLTPEQLLEKLPANNNAYSTVVSARNVINSILKKEDDRLLVIVGPCSAHDEKATIKYAQRLCKLQKDFSDKFFFVMRVYFEKPRTILGWRGLIVDPDINGVINISAGLEKARKILIEINELGLPVATEFLDPIVPQYIADMVSWASVGARSAESQIHRELASGLSMPVGFKNATDGDILAAVNAIVSANNSHGFIGISPNGTSAVMHTTGNENSHLVLRGGSNGTNYSQSEIKKAYHLLESKNIRPSIIIDCSHDNSQKNPEKQPDVLMSVINEIKNSHFKYADSIRGVMLESFLLDGFTNPNNHNLPEHFGRSITDACMGWDLTMKTIQQAYTLYSNNEKNNKGINMNTLNYTNLEIYTDGACSKNPGPGGWAFVVIIDGELKTEKSGAEKNTTNNRMELTAVIEALHFLIANGLESSNTFPKIYTDSKYVQQGILSWIHNWKKNNWMTSQKKPVKNKELWETLDSLSAKVKPEWLWVKAHNNNKYNDLCDKLAVAESKT